MLWVLTLLTSLDRLTPTYKLAVADQLVARMSGVRAASKDYI